MRKLDTYPKLAIAILTILLRLLLSAPAYGQAASGVVLYVSQQTGQLTSYNGTYSKTTDTFGSGSVVFTKTGPVVYSVQPADLSIGPKQTKTWAGSISPDLNNIPTPGTTVPAALNANYNIRYSRPYGTGTNGTVLSTYCCSNNGSMSGTTGCAFHNFHPGMHEIVQDSGTESVNMSVVSILVNIPDTLCLGPAGINNVTASCYPATGGTFLWTSSNPNVQITNATAQTATIKLLDTSIKNATVKVTYTIAGVTYNSTGVLSTCECSCKPITTGISAGPLQLNFNAPPTSAMPDGSGNCNYVANNASFSMSLNGSIVRNLQVPNGATVTFGKNCQTGTLTQVQVDWTGDINIPQIQVAGVNILKLDVTEMHLTVATNGNLSGTVKVKATNTEDRDLSGGTGFVILRKGTNTTITFSFSNANSFAGTWDFSGIQGIVIDLVKKNAANNPVTIANFTGNMTNAGLLTGNLTAKPNASYSTNSFTITLLNLTLGLAMDIPNASFNLTSGSGAVRISNMTAVTGTIDLGLNFPGNGGCTATVGASNITAFTMTLSQLNLTANFNSNFDMTLVQGSLQAKLNTFSANINVSSFVVQDGALKTFSASGNVKYSGFQFSLLSSNYVSSPSSLSFSAKVEINAAGTNAMITVSSFNIASDGSVSIGSISGNFNRAPAALSFTATFGNSSFNGTFNGSFAAIGLSGSVDIGSVQQPQYTYAYLAITAQTNVPLGQSGLKLTRLGGQIGFNYALNFPPPANGGGGNGGPEQNNYVIGLTLGVSDIASLCQVTGNAVVQFSTFSGNVTLTLNGTVDVLANNTFFSGNVNVNYRIPAQTIDGRIGAVIKIPSSGVIITTNNVNVNFNIGGGQWSANGNNMSGEMFGNLIQLTGGSINMSGQLSCATCMSGTLSGQATGAFNYNLGVSALGCSVSGNIALNLNSQINANINQSGLNGSFGVNVNGSGTLTVSTWLGSSSFTGNATATGTASYNNGSFGMSGNMTVTMPISIPYFGNQISTGFSI